MVSALTSTLTVVLSDAGAPVLVRDADVSFDRPSDTYNPQKATLNLFLYDIRENTALRTNEPVVERQNGVATIRQPAMRLDCSYLVTAWPGAAVTGEDAVVKQHELLAEVLQYLIGMPAIPPDRMQGALAQQPYSIPLTVPRGDLTANPAEFWAALGGRLRPSFTLTATIPIERIRAPLTAFEVSSGRVTIRDLGHGAEIAVHQIGGTVRQADTRAPLPEVVVSLPALARAALTDASGQFVFSGLPGGSLTVIAAKSGFTTVTKQLPVPADNAATYDLDLSLNP